jgi:DNA-directed RNA polymerase subunit M/transcription elongation factor TFIIS
MSSIHIVFIDKDAQYRARENLQAINIEDPKDYSKKTVEERKGTIGKISNGIKCKKCGEFTAIRYQKQDRSGDEGDTTYYRCTSKTCGHEWR